MTNKNRNASKEIEAVGYENETWEDNFEADEREAKIRTINYGIELEEGFETVGEEEDMLNLKSLIKEKKLTYEDFANIFNTIAIENNRNKDYLADGKEFGIALKNPKLKVIWRSDKIEKAKNLIKRKEITPDDIDLMFRTIRWR